MTIEGAEAILPNKGLVEVHTMLPELDRAGVVREVDAEILLIEVSQKAKTIGAAINEGPTKQVLVFKHQKDTVGNSGGR